MEKILGKKYPETLTSMHWLALVLQNLEEYEEFEEWYQQTLSLREKILGARASKHSWYMGKIA